MGAHARPAGLHRARRLHANCNCAKFVRNLFAGFRSLFNWLVANRTGYENGTGQEAGHNGTGRFNGLLGCRPNSDH
jgi:hypothetical protein